MTRSWLASLCLLAALLAAAPAAEAKKPRSQLAGCGSAAERLVLRASTHLDRACAYTGGVAIVASGVTLDCRGARIEDPTGEGDTGIRVEVPADVPLSNVTIRNCTVSGFLNNVRIQRDGYKELAAGAEYQHAFSDIVLERSRLLDARGSGVFVGAYVTDVTLRRLEIARAGGVGLYLEAGSKHNLVQDNRIHHNGYKDITDEGVAFEIGGVPIRYESTGREGIAIDGSRRNIVRRNRIFGNSAGGIFFYKNCGEYMSKERRHWVRRYGANGNLIAGNVISDEKNGVWLGSRMSENQFFLECSDPAYVSGDLRRIHRDYAKHNTILRNRFVRVTNGVRVEDNGNRILHNSFRSRAAGAQAVLLGTKERTAALDEPVTDTVVRRNRATIKGNAKPYGWVHGQTRTHYAHNRAGGKRVRLGEGAQPTINPFLFVISFRLAE